MSTIHTINRRAFLASSASLVAMGASVMMLDNVYAATDAGPTNGLHKPGLEGRHHSDDEMQQCIQLCRDCHAMCTQTIAHSLKLGGRHAAPDHIRVLADCAQMCATTVDYMLRQSPFHGRVCQLCSEMCKECGKDCEELAVDDPMLQRCIEMCRTCARSCDRMASLVSHAADDRSSR